ncbi:ComEC/Rec2 family competence protein [bacterium]|nr:ComEC/Rec2 family competence protein [Candidatus Omnitrophota bacterium]MBU2528373.1 ComEC/Rec2 family competence protein [bacterium]MBU3930631.1 ComEC/Rec2 family competence protein [bacterium]MBU4122921.1 ComEC/Rec2 family competence protein [bacterium]
MKLFLLPPIYPVTAAFILGIFAAREQFAVFAVLSAILILLSAPTVKAGVIYAIVFVMGFLNLSMRAIPRSSYPPGAVTVSGEVRLFPKKDSFALKTEKGNVLVWHGGGEKLEGARKSLPQAGDIVTVEGLFSGLEEKKNSFSTDWKRINEAQGVCGRIFAKKIEMRGHPSGFKKFVVGLRAAADKSIGKYFDSDSAAYVRGFLWGEKSGLEKDIIKNFRRAGLMHLLAVSGLHIGLFTAIAAVFLSFFMGRGNALLASVPLAFMYSLLCGATPSSVRAAVMFSIMAVGLRTGRRGALGSSLFAAALFMLILNPLWLFTAAFRLSYLAAAGIIFISPPLFRIFKKIMPSFIAAPLAVGIACQIIIIPVLNETFYEFSLLTPLMNLVVIPIAALLVFALFSFFCAAAVSSWAAGVFASAASLFIFLIDKLLRVTVLVPNAMTGWGHLNILTYGAYYALLFALLSKRKRIMAAAFLFFAAALLWQMNDRGVFRLYVPAFGSGDCCFFTSSGKWYQIGVASDIAGNMAPEYDQFIKYHGIKKIEGCFILSSSIYHIGSFKQLMEKDLVRKFYLRIGVRRTNEFENLLYEGRGRGLFRDLSAPLEENGFKLYLSGEALIIERSPRKIIYAFGEKTAPGHCDVFIGDVYEFCKHWIIPQFEDKEVIIRLGRKVIREDWMRK